MPPPREQGTENREQNAPAGRQTKPQPNCLCGKVGSANAGGDEDNDVGEKEVNEEIHREEEKGE